MKYQSKSVSCRAGNVQGIKSIFINTYKTVTESLYLVRTLDQQIQFSTTNRLCVQRSIYYSRNERASPHVAECFDEVTIPPLTGGAAAACDRRRGRSIHLVPVVYRTERKQTGTAPSRPPACNQLLHGKYSQVSCTPT